MSEDIRERELKAVEATLAALTPQPGLINRDQLLFRAGQASVARRNWLWPTATAALALAMTILAGALLLRPAPAPVENIVYVHLRSAEPSTPDTPEQAPAPQVASLPSPALDQPPTPASYLKLRERVVRGGTAALPLAPPAPALGQGRFFEQHLGLPPGTLNRGNSSPLQPSHRIGEPL